MNPHLIIFSLIIVIPIVSVLTKPKDKTIFCQEQLYCLWNIGD
jgi:hypothetical protein